MENITIWQFILELLTSTIIGVFTLNCYIGAYTAKIMQKFVLYCLGTVCGVVLLIYNVSKVVILWQF